MSDLSIIREGIRAIAGTNQLKNKPDVYIATVDNVDEKARTCSCTLVSGPTEIKLDRVLLMATVDDGFLVIPAKDSTVIIENGQNTEPYIVMYSAIDKVFLVSGDKTFQIDKDGLKLGSDTYGGVPKVKDLTEKYNALENKMNDLINAIKVWVPVPNDGGLSLKNVALADWLTTSLTPTQQADIENKMVQHGDGG